MAGFKGASGNAVEIQGVPVSSTAPTDGQVLKYVAINNDWEPATGGSSGITALTGDVTASGSGSVAATLVGTSNVESIISANTTVAGALQTSGGTMTGQFASTASYSSSSNKGAIALGSSLNYSDTNLPITVVSNVNSYADIVIQNLSTGTGAYAAYAISADGSTATASSYYTEFGVTSSTYSNGAGSLNQPNTTFLTTNSMDLAIGTTTANAIHFVTNNTSTDAMTIASSGAVTIPGALTANGTSIPASSTLLTTASTINATQLQSVAVSSTAPSTGQVLEYSGTSWIPTTLPGATIPTAATAWNGTSLGSVTPSNNIFLTGSYTLTTSNAQIATVTLPAGTWLLNVSLLASNIVATGATVDTWLTTNSGSPTTNVLASTSAQVANLTGNSKFQTMAFSAVLTVATSTTVYLYAVGSSTNPSINNTAVNSVANAAGMTVIRIA
jgi:hypothetical protein